MTRASLGPLPADSPVPELAQAIRRAGGRLLVVGGWVRDQLRRRPGLGVSGEASRNRPGDLDLEVFGLGPDRVGRVLAPFGAIGPVGRQFPVWRLARQDLDIALPRGGRAAAGAEHPDSPSGAGGLSEARLETTFAEAARHRDLTVNAMGWDPLSERLLDPCGGAADLKAGRLRIVDPETFGADPIRGLRVARLMARLGARVDAQTTVHCRALDLSQLPAERLATELRRILLEPARPSAALHWAAEARQLRCFPPLEALRGVPQDPRWHPEGDVFRHTTMVVDEARRIGAALPLAERETLQWAALCHDLGKPATTQIEAGRIRSLQHDRVGAQIASDWLETLRLGTRRAEAVRVLVADHLAPAQYIAGQAGSRAYRRLARRLARGGQRLEDLERLARADHLGRTTPDAFARRFEAGDAFLARGRNEGLLDGPQPDVLTSPHLFARGIEAGPEMGAILDRGRALQDDHGWTDPDRIFEAARQSLAKNSGSETGKRRP